jgi:CHAT domain-containing protein
MRTWFTVCCALFWLLAHCGGSQAGEQPAARVLQASGAAMVVSAQGLPREALLFGAVYDGDRLFLQPGASLVLGIPGDHGIKRVSATTSPLILQLADLNAESHVNITPLEPPPETSVIVGAILRAMPLPPAGAATLERQQNPREDSPQAHPAHGSAGISPLPTFSWPARSGVTAYEVAIYRAGKLLWLAQTETPTIDLPAAKQLEHGATYQWAVHALKSQERQLIVNSLFTTALAGEGAQLEALAASRDPHLVALAAIRYEQSDQAPLAIKAYEKLAQQTPSVAAVYAALGDLHDRAGQAELAAKFRRDAFALRFDYGAKQRAAGTTAGAVDQHRLEHAQRLLMATFWAPIYEQNIQNGKEAAGGADAIELRLREAIAARVKALEEAHVSTAVASMGYLALANFQYANQRIEAAQATLDLLTPYRDSQDVWVGTQAAYWNLSGLLATERDQYALAFDHNSRALRLRRQLALDVDVAESLGNQGFLLLKLGDVKAARAVLEEAAAIYSRVDAKQYPTLSVRNAYIAIGLSKTWEWERDFNKAEELLREVIKIRESSVPDFVDCLCHNNLAVVLYSMGRYGACGVEFDRSSQIATEVLPENHIRRVEGHVNAGWVRLTLGELEAAEDAFRLALEKVSLLDPQSRRVAEIKGCLARVLAERGELAEARRLITEAISARLNETAATLSAGLSRRDRLAYVQMLRVHIESMSWPGELDTFLELAPKLGISNDLQYETLLPWKGIISQFQTEGPDSQSMSATDDAWQSQIDDLRREMRELAAVEVGQRNERRLGELEQEINHLERQVAASGGRAESSKVDVNRLRRALPPGSALLDLIEVRRYQPRKEGEALRDNRAYVAFILKKEGDVIRIDLGDAAEIDTAVNSFVGRISQPRSFRIEGRRVGRLIAAPLQAHLEDVSLLQISADGWLHRLPWCALPGREHPFWVEELAFASIPSAQALLQEEPEIMREHSAYLAVGGVDYGPPDERNSLQWEPLKASLQEATAVSKLLARVFPAATERSLFAGSDATKQAIASRLGRQQFIHLATHGGFRDSRAESFDIQGLASYFDSFLVFAGANRSEDRQDGYLTAEEIRDLDLSGVRLVTLSACETALGHVQAGQGLIGLTSALKGAGAQWVVSALWKVDDAATSDLMIRFYRRLLGNKPVQAVPESLRQAQLELLSASDGQFIHPCFWAAWTATGASRQ